MKKLYLLTGLLSVLLLASCKKSGNNSAGDGIPAENTFTVDGEAFKVGTASAIDEDAIQATGFYSNNTGFGINVTFFNALPTTGGTFQVTNELTRAGQMRVHIATNGGSKVYVSLDSETQTGTVTVDKGKINVKFSNLKLAGNNAAGGITASANITKP